MKVVAVIPARYASQRFPGKPLAPIAGRPMVQWVYEAARRALPRVIVATDDRRILDFIRGLGGEAMLTSRACRSGTDRVAEVARKVRAGVYLNIQGDEPLMSTRTVRAVLALHRGKGVEMGTAATRLAPSDWKDPDTVKVLVDRAGDALYFSRAPIPYVRDGAKAEGAALARVSRGARPALLKHLGIYSYRADLLRRFVQWPEGVLEAAERLEQLRAVQRGVRLRVAFTPDDSVGVDRPGDARRVEKMLKERGRA